MSAENTLTREVRAESGAARRKIVGAQFDQVLLYAVLALCAIGLVMVYSASSVSAATRKTGARRSVHQAWCELTRARGAPKTS